MLELLLILAVVVYLVSKLDNTKEDMQRELEDNTPVRRLHPAFATTDARSSEAVLPTERLHHVQALKETRELVDCYAVEFHGLTHDGVSVRDGSALGILYAHYREAREVFGGHHPYTVAVTEAYFGGKEDLFALPPLPREVS